MKTRYLPTKMIRDIAKDIMEHRLNCGYQTFSILMGRSKSWCNNFINGNTEVRGIYPEDIERLFAIEYNCILFENKLKRMEELLLNAIDSNICKSETTLADIFKKIEFQDDTGNICTRYKIPIEIFYGEDIPIPDKVFYKKRYWGINIFKESAFEKIDKKKAKEYMEILSPEEFQEKYFTEIDDYIKLFDLDENKPVFHTTDKEIKRIDYYITRRLEKLIYSKNSNCLSDYWLYATYFKHTEVELQSDIIEALRKWYCTEKTKVLSWDNVFNTLQITKKESTQFQSGEIYFLNDIKSSVSVRNLPIMFMKYNWKSNEALKTTKVEDAKNGKIKLIDLFMLIYNAMLKKEYGKNEAFEKSCARLYYSHYKVLFDKLNLLDLPYDPNMSTSEESWEFFRELQKLLNSFEFNEINPELIQFKNNFNKGQFNYLKAISIDFSFIENLSVFNVMELNEELTRVVEIYKNENLI